MKSKIGNSSSNSAFDLPSDIERVYFQRGNLGCSVSYLTYGFDQIPPSNPISLIPAISVESHQTIPFEVEGLEEGDLFRIFSDANCADPLAEKVPASNSIQAGIIPPQLSDFTLYGQYYDVAGNPSSCEILQEVTVLNQRYETIIPTVSDQTGFVGPRISGGIAHTCVVKNNQEIDCWGSNQLGRLGDDTFISRGYPSHVVETDGDPTSKFSNAIQVVVGRAHSCALKEDATVYCWGQEPYLGIGSTSSRSKDYPIPVTSSATENLSSITQISSFREHSCAVNNSGNVYCWGNGDNGKIGNGSNNAAPRATLVVDGNNSTTALTGISKVATGDSFTCALKTNGGVLCWGKNLLGQLGNGNTGASHNTNYPVAVIDSSDTAISGISDIESGNAHMCALTNTGKVLCWGAGTSGQLGNDAIVSSDHPVYVVDGDGS